MKLSRGVTLIEVIVVFVVIVLAFLFMPVMLHKGAAGSTGIVHQ